MKVVKVLRKGKMNVSVMTDTFIQVRVPVELGQVGSELDECRIGRLDKNDIYSYLSLNSWKYKRAVVDYSVVCPERWETFSKLVKSCLKKLVVKGWVKKSRLTELCLDYVGYASESGIPYRMWRRPKEVNIVGYIYSSVKGYVWAKLEKEAEERERFVSFEYLEALNLL